MPTPRPELLVSPTWLLQRLDLPNLRVFDCRLTRVPQAEGPSLWKSEKVAWAQGHVPGASYLHLIEDLCDPQARLPFMLPGKEKVSALLGRFGVLDESIIVLYGFAGEWVTHRVWWSLKASGLADVRVLDGGFLRWQSEGQPIERKAPSIDPTEIQCERDERLIATRADTIQSTSSAKIVAVNALAPELFRGEGDQVFGRRGHIPDSINIPSDDLIEAETGRIRPIEDLQAIFLGHGLDAAETIIPYCGGGIAASTLFFALAIAGFENVALYDGSLFDWSSDPTLPMELGA